MYVSLTFSHHSQPVKSMLCLYVNSPDPPRSPHKTPLAKHHSTTLTTSRKKSQLPQTHVHTAASWSLSLSSLGAGRLDRVGAVTTWPLMSNATRVSRVKRPAVQILFQTSNQFDEQKERKQHVLLIGRLHDTREPV